MLKQSMIRAMSNLAMRFVPSASAVVHVVDPDYDLRDRFVDCARLQGMLDARGIALSPGIGDVNRLQRDYERWWSLYCEYEELKEKNQVELLL
jgi:hypothetical protein